MPTNNAKVVSLIQEKSLLGTDQVSISLGLTHLPLVLQSSPLQTRNRATIQPKETLYINERTGHLLNLQSRENNIYHDLLILNAEKFQESFCRDDASLDTDRTFEILYRNGAWKLKYNGLPVAAV